MRAATSARARTATTSTEARDPSRDEPPSARTEPSAVLEALATGELELLGRLVGSSNNAMVVRVWPAEALPDPAEPILPIGDGDLLAVWKPTRGEQPLFDFPIGTLTRREVAAFLVSEALGWGIVPPTLLRDGPFGEGMLQRWIDADPEVDVIAMVNDDDARLRRVAIFDAIVNNTDRKAGHLLPLPDGHLHAVDHGVTFSVVPKLRTVLWAWEGDPLDVDEVAGLEQVAAALGTVTKAGPLAVALRDLLAAPEVDATRARVGELLGSRRFPGPNPDWPALPWPPF